MQRTKYRKISLEPFQPNKNKKTARNQPSYRPTSLSHGKSNKNIQFSCPLQPTRMSVECRKTERQVSITNLKQRRSELSNRSNKKSQLGGFDNHMVQHSKSKSVTKTHLLPGLSKVELSQRKENYLNTYFNIRKNKLKEITKENKKIYDRINSQQSLYSSRQLNGSIDFVSNSRISHKSSQNSIVSLRKSTQSKSNLKKATNLKKKQSKVKFESKDINKLQNTQVNRYLNIFCNNLNLNPKHIQNRKLPNHVNVCKEKENGQNILAGLQRIHEQLQKKKEVKKKMVFGRLI